MGIVVFIGKTLVACMIELVVGGLIAGDYFRGKKGFIVDVLAALFMVGLSWLLTYTGNVREYICKANEVPSDVEGVTFDIDQCLSDTQWLQIWGETFQSSFGMHPVVSAVVLYFVIKWFWPLLKT
ncbi:hypothetical protein [Vibrio parahaemolyticus]|uniref:hypothetical protein n=1 Tax=Vibrio parahaemolyticus TaxID=670 RepID=UPI003892C70C